MIAGSRARLAAVGGAPAEAGVTAIEARGSVNQVSATGALPGTAIELRDGSDAVVDTATTDSQGSILFREVAAGSGYTVQQGSAESDPVTVTGPDVVPPQSLYDGQTIHASALGLTLSGGEPQITHSGTFVNLQEPGNHDYVSIVTTQPKKPIRVTLLAGTSDLECCGTTWFKVNNEMADSLAKAMYPYRFMKSSTQHGPTQWHFNDFPDGLRWLWKGYTLPHYAIAK